MVNNDFFPARPQANPTIYAYADNNPQYKGLLKVGYTIKSAKERVAEQYPTARPNEVPYTILLDEPTIHLDSTRKQELVNLFTELSILPQMIIVTHENQLEVAADNLIKVEKDNGISRVIM